MAWSGFELFQLESADDILSHIIWVKMLHILSADGQRVFYGVVLEKSIGAEYWSGVESDFGVAKKTQVQLWCVYGQVWRTFQ